MRIIYTGVEAREAVLETAPTDEILVGHLDSCVETVHGETLPRYSDPGGMMMVEMMRKTAPELYTAVYKIHCLSQPTIQVKNSSGEYLRYLGSSMMMYAIHQSFADHIPFSLSPDVIWYCIAHELATHINMNQNRYRGHFTVSAKKENIVMRDDTLVYRGDPDQWKRALPKFLNAMTSQVPRETIDLFLPRFTTSTDESMTTLLVLFLNILSNYYNLIALTYCGIPAIRLEGESSDWKKIVTHAEQASREFDGLKAYFADLLPVLREIAGVAAGDEPDPEFWSSMYKYRESSGGGRINGWITTLFAHTHVRNKEYKLRENFGWRTVMQDPNTEVGLLHGDNLTNHISTVPFIWNYYGKMIDMIMFSGFMSIGYDSFLYPKLGYAVLEPPNSRHK